MELHCKNDETQAQLKKAYAEAEKWRLIADEKEKELQLLRTDEVTSEEPVGNEVFTVV